jgi:hypothetical protein
MAANGPAIWSTAIITAFMPTAHLVYGRGGRQTGRRKLTA